MDEWLGLRVCRAENKVETEQNKRDEQWFSWAMSTEPKQFISWIKTCHLRDRHPFHVSTVSDRHHRFRTVLILPEEFSNSPDNFLSWLQYLKNPFQGTVIRFFPPLCLKHSTAVFRGVNLGE